MGKSGPAKKRKCSFNAAIATKYPCLTKCPRQGAEYVYCTICCKSFSISHGGLHDATRHIDGTLHQQTAKTTSGNAKISHMFARGTKEQDAVTHAEVLFSAFIIEHNLPLSVSDHASPLFKKMFPDSKIAKAYGCGRTKTSYITKALAEDSVTKVSAELSTSPYSLATDASNDKGEDKLFPIVTRHFSEEDGKVVVKFVDMPTCNNATAANIYREVKGSLESKQIPLTKCVAYCSDNASVMRGKHNSLKSRLEKDCKGLFSLGCPCHLCHLAAQKAAKKLSFNAEDFLIDLYFWFDKSTKRKASLHEFQDFCSVKTRKLIKYVNTRWLSLGLCVGRALQQWPALTSLFVSQESGRGKTAGDARKARLQKIFADPMAEVYCLFLSATLPLFDRFNTLLQLEAPALHLVRRAMIDLVRSLLVRFVNPEVIREADDITSIDINKEDHWKTDSQMFIGFTTKQALRREDVEDYLASHPSKLTTFYSDVRNFYREALNYILLKFPLEDEVLKNSEVVDIAAREGATWESLSYFAERQPLFYKRLAFMKEIPNIVIKWISDFNDVIIYVILEIVPRFKTQLDISPDLYADFMNELEQEFCVYQVIEIPQAALDAPRIDVAWSSIASMKDPATQMRQFTHLIRVVKLILTLPHSNAEVERIFSLVRKNHTDFRPNMGTSTLTNLLQVKVNTLAHKECFRFEPAPGLLRLAKKATHAGLSAKGTASATSSP